ncbi:MAG: lamin tail domain-containing protein [Elusimicrobiota bacterium]
MNYPVALPQGSSLQNKNMIKTSIKNYKLKIKNCGLFLTFIFHFSFFIFHCLYAASPVRINELTANISGGKDWIEFYNCSSGDINLDQWSVEAAKLSGGANPCKTFPAVTISSGAYFVLKFNDSTADEITADDGDGYKEFYTGVGITGLTGTDNVIVLRNSLSDIVDAVVFCNGDDKWTAGDSLFSDAISANQWTGAVDEGSAAELGSSASKSLARDDKSTDTDAEDVAKTDWQATSDRTEGRKNPAFPVTPPAGAGNIYGKITEVAPGISGGDFVEIYITNGSNITGAKLYEGKTVIKTLPNLNTAAKMYLVVHCSQAGTDETTDTNGNGYIDLYSDESTPGLTGTDNNLTLKNADGTMVDFVSFAEDSSSYTGEQSVYDTAVSTGQWAHPSDVTDAVGTEDYYIHGSVSWSESTTGSITRKIDPSSQTGQPLDTNTKTDWYEGSATKGQGPYGTAAKETTKILEVFQSPFSPARDGKYSYCVIAYNVEANSQVTVRVFDTNGRLVKILLDQIDVPAGGANTVNWDGKDEDGATVSIGVYIVHIEVQNKKTGNIKTAAKRVVVARKI